MEFSQQLESLQTAKYARVVLVPMYSLSPVGYNEESLNRYGCAYASDDPAKVSALVGLIRSAVSTAVHAGESWEQEPRELIYLTLENGEKVVFRFSAKYANQSNIRGVFTKFSSTLPVIADLSFIDAVYQWSVKLGPVNVNNDNALACEYFSTYMPKK